MRQVRRQYLHSVVLAGQAVLNYASLSFLRVVKPHSLLSVDDLVLAGARPWESLELDDLVKEVFHLVVLHEVQLAIPTHLEAQ